MKSLIMAIASATVFAVPASSFAQTTSQPQTRAQVRENLAQLEKAGYNPNDYLNYPANIQRAETVGAQQNNVDTAIGGVTNGTSRTGK
jgi:hypothetical protein